MCINFKLPPLVLLLLVATCGYASFNPASSDQEGETELPIVTASGSKPDSCEVWVSISYTILPNGELGEFEILESNPPGEFDQIALNMFVDSLANQPDYFKNVHHQNAPRAFIYSRDCI